MERSILSLALIAWLSGCSGGGSDDLGVNIPGPTVPDSTVPTTYDLEVIGFSFSSISYRATPFTLRVRNNSAEPIDLLSAMAETVVYISDDPGFDQHWWGSTGLVRTFTSDITGEQIGTSASNRMLPSGHEATMRALAELPHIYDGAYFVKAEINPSRLLKPRFGQSKVSGELWENVKPEDDHLFVESNYTNNISNVLGTEVVNQITAIDNSGTCHDEPSFVTPTGLEHAINLNVGVEQLTPSCKTGSVLYSVEMIENTAYEITVEASTLTTISTDGTFIYSEAPFRDIPVEYVPSYTGTHYFYLFRSSRRNEYKPVLVKIRT